MRIVKIEVKNSQNGSSTLMEVDGSTRLQEILDSAVEFWSLTNDAYLLKAGRRLLSTSKTVDEGGLKEGDVIELLPDPEGG